MAKTSLKVSQILAWADACHERTGVWPRSTSGHIPGVPGETWKQVDAALRLGYRGLRGGSSLARLLARQRGVPPYRAQRTLSVEQILAWADAYHERTGCWPKCSAERIRGTRMRWSHVNRALRGGLYGLPRAFSLAR